MNNYKVVQFEGFFLVIGREVLAFQGEVKDYIYSTDEEYFNCDYLTHKVNKTLSGLIR